MADGNTPTGVGTTVGGYAITEFTKKHPHGRGDDPGVVARSAIAGETPPRAWGRPRDGGQKSDRLGNTPTGVGTTHRHHAPE